MTEPVIVQPDAQHADILADAFIDDPFMAWIFGDHASRLAALPTWWAFIGAHTPEGAELWRIDDHAASLWYPPRHAGEPDADPDPEPEPESDEHDDDAPNPFVEMMLPFVGPRLPEILEMLGRGHDARPDEPFWYLLALGTRATSQGHGYGARIVRPVLDRCDAEGIGTYLESSNPKNIPFYHRLGYEIVNETWTPDDAAVMTGMWRAPR